MPTIHGLQDVRRVRSRAARSAPVGLGWRAVCVLVVSFGCSCLAAQAAPSAQDLRDAILGRRTFTQEQLQQMDLNGDGKVDAADLAKRARILPLASFEAPTSEATESTASISVRVLFSEPFVGTLRYTVSGTAQAGTDYVLPTGQLQVNGAQVDIQIGLLDDSVYEETVKTLSISLFYEAGAGLGYGLGTSIEHTVYIRDNDAVWRGQIENGGTVIPVAMRVVRNGAAVSVTLIGDEYGIIPTNSRSAEWPASGVTFTDTHFGAVVAGMTVAASRTLTNLPIRRRFEFVADAATPGHVVDLNARVSGTLTETLTVEGHEYLNRTSTGGFLLLREVPRVDVPEPQLVSAGRIGSR